MTDSSNKPTYVHCKSVGRLGDTASFGVKRKFESLQRFQVLSGLASATSGRRAKVVLQIPCVLRHLQGARRLWVI